MTNNRITNAETIALLERRLAFARGNLSAREQWFISQELDAARKVDAPLFEAVALIEVSA